MAEVFKAKSYGVEGFEKVVVIKRILPELAENEQFVEMFIREAKLAVRLSHANVVQVFDLGIAPPSGETPSAAAYYMAMEYVSGLDLATLLARGRRQSSPIPIEMAVFIAAEVAKGLDHAHRRRDEQNRPLNIVHLDVSPQNVLLSLEGEVKVTDFGIAKARGAVEHTDTADTRSRQLKGKFGYMSPEQVAGDRVDARSDLFSLGTVLYEMLAGVNPFSAPTSFETLRRVSVVEYPPVELLRPETPAELIDVLKTSMAPKPEDRFADAGRMYEALLAFLYTQGRRFSAHDLADFLTRFRSPEESGPALVLDAESAASQERTPVEVPGAARHRSSPSITKVETGVPIVDVERAAEMGERREVTALVVEVPGREDSTLSERAAQTIARHGGRVLACEPEQVTALFGLGDPDGRDTEVATRCALVVLRALSGSARQPSAGLHASRIHVRSDDTPTHDERLASLITHARELARTREGMCAISASAMRQVRSLFVFEALNDSDGRRTGSIAPGSAMLVKDVRGASEAFGRFVGRRAELRVAGEVLAKATRRNASALTVRGDHGIGKTRLLLEVERRLRKGGYNVGFYLATCLPRGTELPLSGIQCMMHVLCGIAEGDSETRIRRLVPRLRGVGLHDDEVGAVLTSLGASAGIPQVRAKTSLTNALTRMVLRLCEDRPHAFVWDAAHCMDSDSYGVLEAVMARLPQARSLFVFAARAGFSHPIEKLPVHTALDLADLEPEDAERLVAVRLGVDRVPGELLRFIRQRSGGHPQMIEEVLKALIAARAVTAADGSIVTMKLASQELALPKTLRGLVASRVARLAAADRAILQAAAVLGEPIDAAVLAQMTGLDLATLDRSLAVLRERDFLVHTGPLELMFRSPIVREVVVDALTVESTRTMHAAAGRALETTFGEQQAAEHAARIAMHLYGSGERERAGEWFAKSAARRFNGGQLEAASRDFARAIELCEPAAHSPAELANWLSGLAKAVFIVRTLPDAMELCERVMARVDACESTQADGLELRVRVRVDTGRILGALHMLDAARAQFSAAEAIAHARPDLAKSAIIAAAELAGRQGDFKRSLALLERVHSVSADKVEEHKLLVSLAQANAAMGARAAAMRHFEAARTLFPDDPMFVCERYKLHALIDYFARDFRAAAIHSEKSIDLSIELGQRSETAIGLHNLGDILVRLDDHPRAYGALKQSLALCDELGHDRLASHNRMFLAYLDGRAGDADAERVLRQGIQYAEANDFTWDVLGGHLLLAKLLEKRGDIDAARLEYRALRDLARAAGNRLVADDCEAALKN